MKSFLGFTILWFSSPIETDSSSFYYDYVMPYFHHQSGGGVCGLGRSRWENTSDALQCRYCPAVDGTTNNTSPQSVLRSTLNIHNFSNTTTVCIVSSPDPPFLFGGGSGDETAVCSAVNFSFSLKCASPVLLQ